mmetsp:Transcript_7983/g.10204  ORF Transcript_7983/g.10204 Transcript_7983/m.10204 type:complete len:334 (-) Transcript_7983:153-1154(-)|eukprot:CAMPEP_0116070874 /NCGR_PEP_ID=MMETSP0322-20121206/13357_1 /TAXON_ID=163516 /ORGANISM="Leptocylindrus danicus var. apora, Strain B651" /LENGTH=333 /DNA_ID=CAMNT_0003558941 /DNA_START=23 /DNA_END=1024 /DNA_ORIENTATION=+
MTETSTQKDVACTTADASDIYDRQIRLWGADAQSKISSARILYVYCTGLNMEVMKNLVLAGVQPAILDGRPYPDAVMHTPSSFFPTDERSSCENGNLEKMSVAKAIQNHVHELNPLLEKCEVNEECELSKIPDEYFFKFDVVLCSTKLAGITQCGRIARAVTESGGKFIASDVFGLAGVAVLDLGRKHQFRREIGKNKLSECESMEYPPFKQVFARTLGEYVPCNRWNKKPPILWALYKSFLKCDNFEKVQSFLRNEGVDEGYIGNDERVAQLYSIRDAEVSPVCAVLGGVLGQEVIKALSGKGEPARNVLLFDGGMGFDEAGGGACRAVFLQ